VAILPASDHSSNRMGTLPKLGRDTILQYRWVTLLECSSMKKEHYTLELSAHQARGLNVALHLAKQLMEVPENTPVYPNLMADGIGHTLAKEEFTRLLEDVRKQFEEQDKG
jgi:hypothetical protein